MTTGASWARRLDAIVAQDRIVGEPPPFVGLMRIAGIEGWEPGRVWGKWTV